MRHGRYTGLKRPNSDLGRPTPTPQAAALWTPANATPGAIAAWWDVSDAATRTSSNDNRIDSLADKSGNGHTLTGATTTRPNFNYDWIGREAAGFDGVDDVLVSNTAAQAQPLSVYASIVPFDSNPSANNSKTVFDAGSVLFRTKELAFNLLVYAGSYNRIAVTPTIGVAQLARARWNAGTGYIAFDAGTENSATAGTNNISNPLRWGNSAAGDAPYGGFIGEQIMVSGSVAPDSDLDQRLHGYMGWHWGTFWRLPSAHPYRYVAPKVGVTPAIPSVTPPYTQFIPHGPDGSWNATNIFDPCMVDHPSDPTKKYLYCSGQQLPVGTGVASIGLYEVSVANPTAAPTFVQVVLSTPGSGWASGANAGLRLGSVLKVGSTYYMYFCTQTTTVTNEIGVATSTDGINFTIQGASALITFSGDEVCLGEPAIWWEGGVATIIYSYRTSADVLPGYRFATASSLMGTFTKSTGIDILRRFSPGIQVEAHQIIKRNGRYYLLCEVGGSIANATPYRIYLASCATLTGQYEWEKLVIAEATSGAPYHVATPGLYSINGVDYLYTTVAPDFAQPYYNNRWNMDAGVATGVFDLAA